LAAAINDDASYAAATTLVLDQLAQNLSDHATDEEAHGATGAVVGTTNTQTLTNKTMSGESNTFSAIPQSAITDLVSDISTIETDISTIEGNVTGLENAVALRATSADPTFTGTVILPSTTSIGTLTSTELGYLDGITSSVQTQLDAKADTSAIAEAAQDAVNTALVAGTGLDKTYDDEANTITIDIDSTVATKTYADNAVTTHKDATTDIHGIADTSALATKSYADTAVSTHSAETTGIHGIADTSALALTADVNEALDLKAPLESPTFTGTVTLPANTISQSMMGDDSVGTNELGGLSVTEGKIADGAVTNAKVSASAAIAQSKIENLTTDLGLKAALDSPTFTGTVVLPSTTSIGDVSATELGYLDGVTSSVQTQLTARLPLAGGTMTGALTLSADPSSSLHAATKQYVDNTASGIVAKPQVLGATDSNIDATYNNGTAGVGATLTHNTNGEFPAGAGGASGWAVGKGILVRSQTNKAQNGRYYISDMGSASTPYVLTRCGYCDEASEIPGAYIFVQDGTFAGTGWIQTVADPSTFVVGTDQINVFQFSGSGTITAGTNISVTGNEVSTVSNPSFASATIGDVSNTELQYLNGVTSAVQTQLNSKTPELFTFDSTSGTTKTLASADAFKSLKFTDAGAITVTVPTHASDAIPVGTYVELYQWGGQITVVAATPATTSIRSTDSQNKSRTTYSAMVLIKVDNNEWLLTGDLTA
jgi:hypothetical protein